MTNIPRLYPSRIEIGILIRTSLAMAACVTAIAVVIAFFGALAYARYDWKGRRLYQKIVLLPIFFPQPVLNIINPAVSATMIEVGVADPVGPNGVAR